MFVEPEPGSGFDKVSPAYFVRRAVRWFSSRRRMINDESSVQQESTAADPTKQDR
ncbi:MAG TPA: hypothetical protein VGJ63_15330 [Micromonosporaceae bacterium]|jgi:hypothetical protein